MVILFTVLIWTQLSLAGTENPRVVAVGDLHGDLDNALQVLEMADVVDNQGNWAGGNTILVQTGDTTDRGPDSRALLDMLMRLETQAQAQGGRVMSLLGNHEVMNLIGDWRYVDPGDLVQFGGADARRTALSEAGVYGSWLRTRPIAVSVQQTVFVHGGITPSYASQGLDAINASTEQTIKTGDGPAMKDSGPLWYRGYVLEPEPVACPKLQQALESLQAKRMVVGHTTRRDGRIESRCGGALLVIDIGIAEPYGSNLGCLQIIDGDAQALYPSGPSDLPDPEP